MKFRPFGNLGWDVSALGFGAMRLPVINKDHSKIDEPQATRMLHYAIDNGVNYVDTAYIYHGGNSEKWLGRALKNGYREKVKIATKLPSWFVKEKSDFDRFLNEQLERLQTDTIEVYLLHGLNSTQWPNLRDLDVLEWADQAKQDGRIQHLGFSFHDSLEQFKAIVDAYDRWEVCQIQYNYMDIEFQAGSEGLQYAADRDIAVIIMEPLRGGNWPSEHRMRLRRCWPHPRSLAASRNGHCAGSGMNRPFPLFSAVCQPCNMSPIMSNTPTGRSPATCLMLNSS